MTAGAELRGDELIARRHLPAPPERVWAAFVQRRLPAELRTAQAADGLASILDALAAHLRPDKTTPGRRMS